MIVTRRQREQFPYEQYEDISEFEAAHPHIVEINIPPINKNKRKYRPEDIVEVNIPPIKKKKAPQEEEGNVSDADTEPYCESDVDFS